MIGRQTDVSARGNWPEYLTWKARSATRLPKFLREPVHLIQPPINSRNSHSVRSLTMLRRIQTPASDSGLDLRNRTVAYTDRYATAMSKCSVKNGKADRRSEKRAVVSGPLCTFPIKSAPENTSKSAICLFHVFFFFFFSFTRGHNKSFLLPQNSLFQAYYSSRWRYAGKTGHTIKPLQKASCFNILGGNWISLFVKRALVLG